ncbi:MAG: hypothetical protein LRZ93_01775 [Clostridiales bacterium]|nr:hypothetical protein [Clostridiales bacterium]
MGKETKQKRENWTTVKIIRNIFRIKSKSKYFYIGTFVMMIVGIVSVYFVGMEVGCISYTVLN